VPVLDAKSQESTTDHDEHQGDDQECPGRFLTTRGTCDGPIGRKLLAAIVTFHSASWDERLETNERIWERDIGKGAKLNLLQNLILLIVAL
jgi:hypothetical protein